MKLNLLSLNGDFLYSLNSTENYFGIKINNHRQEVEKCVFLEKKYFSDKISIFPATQDFSKYKPEIERFVEVMNESPNLHGYIRCVSSRKKSKRLVKFYANKLKMFIETNYKINAKRLTVEIGSGAIEAFISLDVE